MKAVIIAAGRSSRLWKKTRRTPKTLLPFGDGTILSTIIENMKSCGIRDFVLVVGWKKSKIENYVRAQDDFGVAVQFVTNEQWLRGNGISVLAAHAATGADAFILSMCDHIVSPSAISRVMQHESEKNLLLVDKRVNAIFDIDDATKVRLDGTAICGIGKELQEYDGIDCGVFRLDDRFYQSMQRQLVLGNESISAAVAGLISQHDMGAVFMHDDEEWIDIDTPEAYLFSLSKQKKSPVLANSN